MHVNEETVGSGRGRINKGWRRNPTGQVKMRRWQWDAADKQAERRAASETQSQSNWQGDPRAINVCSAKILRGAAESTGAKIAMARSIERTAVAIEKHLQSDMSVLGGPTKVLGAVETHCSAAGYIRNLTVACILLPVLGCHVPQIAVRRIVKNIGIVGDNEDNREYDPVRENVMQTTINPEESQADSTAFGRDTRVARDAQQIILQEKDLLVKHHLKAAGSTGEQNLHLV
ncbi:hypothetical protein B0H16DRAFT_1452114 [Mycena metata]|uniref:Uncharacterized protein n=1 Tax=Mycena metata TaxID=1033252 RepID=A0AAD7NQS9_9AGAR|nr:hypothetical protein B0H16DRAFT_1452114 [Mycena metata]